MQIGLANENWEKVKNLFQDLLDAPTTSRESMLDVMEIEDKSLASNVRWLYVEFQKAEGFLDGADATDGPAFEPGQKLASRFLIIQQIGVGGMGEVYEARDETLQELVAIKTIRRQAQYSIAAKQRFLREVQRARKITHTNICRIFDVFEDSSSGVPAPFFAMELLSGNTLSKAIRESKPLPFHSIAVQITQGLVAAHSSGILHRDLKPANIILVEEVRGTRAVITDFGLAAPLEECYLATPGGTRGFMAPELLQGAPPSIESDLYSLGQIFKSLLPQHPITARCLRDNPAERPQCAQEVLEALQSRPYLNRRTALVAGVAAAFIGGFVWKRKPSLTWRGRRRLIIDSAQNTNVVVAEALLMEALHQSPQFSVIPVSDIQSAKERVQKRGAATMDDVCRELNAPLLLKSRLEFEQGKWLWNLELRDVEKGESFPAMQENLGASPKWIQAVDRVSLTIREIAGESKASVKQYYVPLESLTSDSIPALEGYYEALRRIEAGETNEPLALLNEAITHDPRFAMAHHEKARVLSMLAKEVSAREASEQAFQLRGRTSPYERMWIEGMYFAFRRDTSGALEVFRTLTTLFSDDSRALRQFAQLCGLALRTGEAVIASKRLAQLDPYSPLARTQLAMFVAEDGQDKEALAIIAQARKEGMEHPSFHWAEGQTYLDLQRFEEARTSFRAMEQSATFQRAAQMRLSALAIHQGRYGEAISSLEAGLSYDISSKEQQLQFRAHHWLASLYAILGREQNSATHIEAIVSLPLDPTCLEAHRHGLMSALLLGRLDAGGKAAANLIEIHSRWPARQTKAMAAQGLGQIALAKRDVTAAVSHLLESVGLWPDPLTRLALSWAHSAAGNHEAAAAVLADAATQRGFLLRRENPAYLQLIWLGQARSEFALSRFSQSERYYKQLLSVWKAAGDFSLHRQATNEFAVLKRQVELNPSIKEIN